MKRYDKHGQPELMTRLQTRRQLEQWQQCRSIHAQLEQYADEYEYQHWLSRRQELRLRHFAKKWPQAWLVITILARVQKEDLQFGLSKPAPRLTDALAKYNSLGWIPANQGIPPGARVS